MPRTARIAPGGFIYHVFNRGVGRTLFRSRKEFEVFQRCLIKTQGTTPMRMLAYCVMDDHWHLVLWPESDGDLARFMLRLTTTHVRRWLIDRHQVGAGHVYQARYKSFAIQKDDHLATVCRYVERNPRRVNAAKSSKQWPWSSSGQHLLGAELQVELADLPIARRRDWVQWVDRPQTSAEEAALERCLKQSRPFGDDRWLRKVQTELGWQEPQKIGRPRKRK